ncbi:hypothetical protein CK203_006850 [Vitis vinifera]|uniref:Uncharacterized protein n=1 Tax=Vitis vinifera TaxID=29760 RepID=A0A438KCL2_VITVI|nr:hypothetical protein CK203_006850 [Vitis vinifera]
MVSWQVEFRLVMFGLFVKDIITAKLKRIGRQWLKKYARGGTTPPSGASPEGRRRPFRKVPFRRARRSPESPPTVRPGQNDAVLACSSIPAPFSGLSQPKTTPNCALASAVLEK